MFPYHLWCHFSYIFIKYMMINLAFSSEKARLCYKLFALEVTRANNCYLFSYTTIIIKNLALATSKAR